MLSTKCVLAVFDFQCTTSQWDVIWRTWTYDIEFSILFLNLDKVLNNSTPGKIVYI